MALSQEQIQRKKIQTSPQKLTPEQARINSSKHVDVEVVVAMKSVIVIYGCPLTNYTSLRFEV